MYLNEGSTTDNNYNGGISGLGVVNASRNIIHMNRTYSGSFENTNDRQLIFLGFQPKINNFMQEDF